MFTIQTDPLLASVVGSVLIVATKPWHGRWTTRTAATGHSTHSKSIPRVGGIAMLAGLVLARYQQPDLLLLQHVVGLGLVVFGIGLIEDLTHSISARHRLFICLIAGALAAGYGGYVVRGVGVPLVDAALGVHQVAVVFSAFAIAGLCSAVNMVDGKNGLAAGSVALSLAGVCALALQNGQADLAQSSVMFMYVIAGFLAINWPWGRLFMGDCGAYLLGFALALCLIDLAVASKVSPWVSLVLVMAPVTEVLHSVWRRARSGQAIDSPDTLHLHNLVRDVVVDRVFAKLGKTSRNSCVAPLLLLMQLPSTAMAVAFAGSTGILVAVALVHVVVQVAICEMLATKRAQLFATRDFARAG